MRVLFVHEVNYLTKPRFEIHDLPEALALRGHTVGFLHFPEGFTRDQIRGLGWIKEISGRTVPSSVIKLLTPQYFSGSLFSRLLTALIFPKVAHRAIRDFQPDIVVCYSVPTSGWQTLRVCKKLGVPFVFRALDVSHKIRKTVIEPAIMLAEKYIYKNADWLSANNLALLSYCKNLSSRQGNYSVEYPPIDRGHFILDSTTFMWLKESLGIPNSTKLIVYMGSFFYFSGLEVVIEVFAKNRQDGENLLLIGGGEIQGKLEKLAETLGVHDAVIFTGFVPYTELPKFLGLADVCINPMHVSLVSNLALPNKVLQYLAAGKKVVTTKLSGLMSVFEDDDNIIFCSSPEDVTMRAFEICRGLTKSNEVALPINLDQRFDFANSVTNFEKMLLEATEV